MIHIKQDFGYNDSNISLKNFCNKTDLYIKRPPYQRKSVWTLAKKQKFVDSLFRKYFIPRIILREVIPTEGVQKFDVIDGQQRITAIQEFFKGEFKTPLSLNKINNEFGGRSFLEMTPEVQEYFEELELPCTKIGMINDPYNKKHQKIVAGIFERLNSGVSLSNIEIEHSKLYSAPRNFIVKYADDISFDNEEYTSKEDNPNRHLFFKIIKQNNTRLQNLALLAKFLIIEFENGPSEVNDVEIAKLMNNYPDTSLDEFELKKEVINCKKMLGVLYEIFNHDKFLNKNGKAIMLSSEYFILSTYILLRKLSSEKYNFGRKNYEEFRDFIFEFFSRWINQEENDDEVTKFSNKRQQDKSSTISRDIILTAFFFEKCPHIAELDEKRSFELKDKIKIFRKDKGICQNCEKEISWAEFEADHIVPHSKTGRSVVENGQLLCIGCNRSKGAKE